MTGQVPTPLSATVRGLPPALVISSVAIFGPGEAGWNATATDVEPPPGITAVPGAPTLNSAALAPVIAKGGVNVMLTASLLPSVTVAAALEPGATVLKSIDAGVTESPAVPTPDNGIDTVPLLELATTSVALFGPTAVGWKVTVTVVVPAAPVGSAVAPGNPTENDGASAPAIVNGV